MVGQGARVSTLAPASLLPLQVWTQAPAGLGLLVTYWTLLYAITAFQESKLHLD